MGMPLTDCNILSMAVLVVFQVLKKPPELSWGSPQFDAAISRAAVFPVEVGADISYIKFLQSNIFKNGAVRDA
jgi:hypothetical protein